MVTAIHARVLLDTGPDMEELDVVRRRFADAGMTVDMEGHSYGGPPPTSMFVIVVNVPLVALLDRLADEAGGAERLETLVRDLHAIRADARRWGCAHVLKLEDTHGILSVSCQPDLASEAYAALLRLDLTPFDRGSPAISCIWRAEGRRWLGRIDALPRQAWRALPTRGRPGPSDTVRPLQPAEVAALWRVVQASDTPIITWQRANVVLLSALGWNVASTVAKTMLSSPLICRVLANFNRDGFAALSSSHPDCGPEPDEAALGTARQIAATPPEQLGVPAAGWDATSLGQFLVRHAVVEDASERWVSGALLDPHPVTA